MIFLALKYILAKKKQSCLILLGIFLGTCGFVTISGLLLGWKEFFVQELIHKEAHLFIKPKKQLIKEHDLDNFFYKKNTIINWVNPPSKKNNSWVIENPSKWYKILNNDSDVLAFSPRFTAYANFSCARGRFSANIIGCHPDNEMDVKNIKPYVISGRFEDIQYGSNRIAIGDGIANVLGLKLNQTIKMSIDQNKFAPYKIVAIFKTKNPITNYQVYGLLKPIQEAAKKPNEINEINVKLKDYTQAKNIAQQLSSFGGELIESWDQIYSNIFKMCLVNDAIRYASTGIIMLIAGFGIYNVLNMTVMQKRKDIVILKSMGYNSKNILNLFFSQGLLLGIIGSSLGLFFGFFISFYLQKVLPKSVFSVSFNLNIYLQAVLIGVGFSAISSAFPARHAKKLSPIEIIRAGGE